MSRFLLVQLGLAASGIGAGFINTMAGGGSMLKLPVLMLLGLPAGVANGTNRLSVVTQSASGVVGFSRGGALDRAAIARVIVPTVLGSLIGAAVASCVPDALLKVVLLATMVTMAALLAIAPRLVSAPAEGQPRWDRKLAGFGGLFAAGLYGGFVQAGVGFVLIGVLGGVLRYDIIRANALKLVCTFLFGVVSLAVFVVAGEVAWVPAALLAVYTVIGAQLGVKFALKVRPGVLRWILFVTVAATSVAAYLKG